MHTAKRPECEAAISLIDVDETSLYPQGGLGIGWVSDWQRRGPAKQQSE